MAINTQRIVKNTGILYFRMLGTMLVSFYTSRVVLKTLGVEDFGIYNVVGGIVVLFSFISGTIATSTQRYLNYELGKQNKQGVKLVFNTSLVLYIIIGLAIVLLAETIGYYFFLRYMVIPIERLDAAKWVFHFAILSFFLNLLSGLYQAVLIAHENMGAFSIFNVLDVILKLLIAIGIGYISYDKLKIYSFFIFLLTFFLYLLYLIYCKRKYEETSFSLVKNLYSYRELSYFAIWNIFGAMVSAFKTQGVNIILNLFYGPIINASYGVARQVNAALVSFVQNYLRSTQPQIIQSYSAGEKEQMMKLTYFSSKVSFILFIFFAIPLFFEMNFIISKWLINVPDYAVIFCKLIIIETLLDTFTYPIAVAILAIGRIRNYQLTLSVIQLLSLPIIYFFLTSKMFDPQIVVYIGIVINIIALFFRVYFISILTGYSSMIFYKEVLMPSILVLTLSVLVVLPFSIIMETGWIKLIAIIGIACMSTIGFTYLLGLNKSEKLVILQFVKHKILNKKREQ